MATFYRSAPDVSLWDDLPADLRDSGSLDALEPVLDSVATPTATEVPDADGTWKVYETTIVDDDPLSLDPATGRFRRAAGTGSTPIEFPDPRVPSCGPPRCLALWLTAAGSAPSMAPPSSRHSRSSGRP